MRILLISAVQRPPECCLLIYLLPAGSLQPLKCCGAVAAKMQYNRCRCLIRPLHAFDADVYGFGKNERLIGEFSL